jgi:hypothetical protein
MLALKQHIILIIIYFTPHLLFPPIQTAGPQRQHPHHRHDLLHWGPRASLRQSQCASGEPLSGAAAGAVSPKQVPDAHSKHEFTHKSIPQKLASICLPSPP